MTKRLSEETETRLTGPSSSGKSVRNILQIEWKHISCQCKIKTKQQKNQQKRGTPFSLPFLPLQIKIHNDLKKMTAEGGTSYRPFAAVKVLSCRCCITLTSFQEHICKIKRPKPQEAIFRARATESWGHTDAIDGNACIWSTQSQTQIFILPFSFSNYCPALNFKTGSLFHPDFERTCLQRRFPPAACMQLLCRLQPPDVFDYYSTVVNFEHITIPTAGISVGKQPRKRKMTATNFG